MIGSEAPTEAAVEDLQRCLDDIARLNALPATWSGLAPTVIIESLLEALSDMLGLDFAGFRFNDATQILLRVSKDFGASHPPDRVHGALDRWLIADAEPGVANLTFGCDSVRTLRRPLGNNGGLGELLLGARRTDFPKRTERLRLDVAAAQAGLACREARQPEDPDPPGGRRAAAPRGKAPVEAEWRLNLIVNSIPAMAWSATPDGMLDYGNQHFLDFIGGAFEEIAGVNFYRIFHPDDVQAMLSAWQDIMSTKRSREVEGRIRRADGEYRWCALRQRSLLDDEGNVVRWFGVVLDIEDRKRAETALKATQSALLASEQNLNLIINSLPVLVWSARPDGSADFINQGWLDYVGLDAERILEWGFLEHYHPDDVDGMVEAWKTALETSDHSFLKGRIRRADGQYRWFYFYGRKLTDANGVVRWYGVNVDVEDLQRAENALRDSEAALRDGERRLQHIINTIPGLVWSADPEGAVTFVSQQYLDYTGLASGEAAGHGWTAAVHPDDLPHLLEVWTNAVKLGSAAECEARLRNAAGEPRWFLFRASPFHDDMGRLTQWFGVNVDIEDRKRAEDYLRQSQSDVAHVARMMTMGELAVSIAHEVNQPLMAIVTNASATLRWLDDAKLDVPLARLAVQRIVNDGHRAGDIVTSIRALARKSPPRMERIVLEDVIQGVLELLRGEVQRRGVMVKTEFAAGSLILGDRTQLQQVVLNLVMNAVEAMAGVGREPRLTVQTLRGQGVIQVNVQDSGPGLTAEERVRVFEAFFTTKPEGMGMGLSICRSIIDSHGGEIWASDVSPGSTFSFTLPLAEGPS